MYNGEGRRVNMEFLDNLCRIKNATLNHRLPILSGTGEPEITVFLCVLAAACLGIGAYLGYKKSWKLALPFTGAMLPCLILALYPLDEFELTTGGSHTRRGGP